MPLSKPFASRNWNGVSKFDAKGPYQGKRGGTYWITESGDKTYNPPDDPKAKSGDTKTDKHRQKAQALQKRKDEVPKGVLGRVKEWVQKKYEALSERYGPTGAKLVMAGMIALLPVPLPGTSLLPIAIAEGVRGIKRLAVGHAEFAELAADELVEMIRAAIEELYADNGEPMPELDADDLLLTAEDLLGRDDSFEAFASGWTGPFKGERGGTYWLSPSGKPSYDEPSEREEGKGEEELTQPTKNVQEPLPPEDLPNEKLFRLAGHQFESLQQQLGIKNPKMGPEGAAAVRAALAKRPGGKAIAEILSMEADTFRDNGLPKTAGDAQRRLLDGKYSAEQLLDVAKWASVSDDWDSDRFLYGIIKTSKTSSGQAVNPDAFAYAQNAAKLENLSRGVGKESAKALITEARNTMKKAYVAAGIKKHSERFHSYANWQGPFEGPRGGRYWISPSGEHSYEGPQGDDTPDARAEVDDLAKAAQDPKQVPRVAATIGQRLPGLASGIAGASGNREADTRLAGQMWADSATGSDPAASKEMAGRLTAIASDTNAGSVRSKIGQLGSWLASLPVKAFKGLFEGIKSFAGRALKAGGAIALHLGGIALGAGIIAAATLLPAVVPPAVAILAAFPIGYAVRKIGRTTARATGRILGHSEGGEWVDFAGVVWKSHTLKDGSAGYISSGGLVRRTLPKGQTEEKKEKPAEQTKPTAKPAAKVKANPADVEAKVKEFQTKEKVTPNDVKDLAGHIQTLTVAQIGELKTKLGIKATGVKAAQAKAIAEKALASKPKPPEVPKPVVETPKPVEPPKPPEPIRNATLPEARKGVQQFESAMKGNGLTPQSAAPIKAHIAEMATRMDRATFKKHAEAYLGHDLFTYEKPIIQKKLNEFVDGIAATPITHPPVASNPNHPMAKTVATDANAKAVVDTFNQGNAGRRQLHDYYTQQQKLDDELYDRMKAAKEGTPEYKKLNDQWYDKRQTVKGLESHIAANAEESRQQLTQLMKPKQPVTFEISEYKPGVFGRLRDYILPIKETFEGGPNVKEGLEGAKAFMSGITDGGGVQKLTVATSQDGRAYYGRGEIGAAWEAGTTAAEHKKTFIHEMGHHLEESNSGVRKAAREFLSYRVGNEKTVDLATVPGGESMKGEKGRKDSFDRAFDAISAHYVGKDYGRKAPTEIVSMGIERMYEDPASFIAKDPEYAQFIIGVLQGRYRSQ